LEEKNREVVAIYEYIVLLPKEKIAWGKKIRTQNNSRKAHPLEHAASEWNSKRKEGLLGMAGSAIAMPYSSGERG
jgi:hypothetical protein